MGNHHFQRGKKIMAIFSSYVSQCQRLSLFWLGNPCCLTAEIWHSSNRPFRSTQFSAPDAELDAPIDRLDTKNSPFLPRALSSHIFLCGCPEVFIILVFPQLLLYIEVIEALYQRKKQVNHGFSRLRRFHLFQNGRRDGELHFWKFWESPWRSARECDPSKLAWAEVPHSKPKCPSTL